MKEEIKIRSGTREDVPEVLALIKELAVYERAPDQVKITAEQMVADGFGDKPLYRLLVAEAEGKIVGISLFYYRYSTWKGKGLYLEDLVVTQGYRRKGIGEKLLKATAQIAKKENCTGLYWQVLDWNAPAIQFYKRWDVKFDQEWINCKLDRDGLGAF